MISFCVDLVMSVVSTDPKFPAGSPKLCWAVFFLPILNHQVLDVTIINDSHQASLISSTATMAEQSSDLFQKLK